MNRFKKLLAVSFAVLTLLSAATIKSTFAVEEEFQVKSKSAYQVENETGTVIYAKNENVHLPIASMCKIMTQLLCYEEIANGNLQITDEVTISSEAAGMGGSQVFLEAGAVYTVDELLKSISVASANDACVAMAEKVCGNVSDFVSKMNDKAKSLGMNDTLFANCTGLPSPEQYSTAKDVSVMFRELIKHVEYFKYSSIWTDEIKHPGGRVTGLTNTNKLVRFYNGCDSGKTGFTSEAGHCLCASAKRDGMRLITVVIGAPDSKRRFFEVSRLFDNAFGAYCSKPIIKSNENLEVAVKVEKGKKDSIAVRTERDLYYFCKKNEKVNVETDFEPIERVKAPVNSGDVVGKLTVFKDGVAIGEVNVIAAETVLAKTYFDSIKDILSGWKF